MSFQLSTLDIAIIAIYFIMIFAIGFKVSRRGHDSSGYFLAGRHVGWFAVGAALFASNISSEHFIGLAGTGAASGMAVGHFEWLASIIVLILGWVFIPFYIRSGVFTMPEFLEKRYGSASRWYLTTVSILAYVLTKISVTLFAGGLLLKTLLGMDMMTSAIILVIATGFYTVIGGLAAVIYTELVQTFVLIGGALLLTIIGINEVGGIAALGQAVPPDYWSMFKPMSHPDFPWTGIIFGAPILGIWYWCTDQFIVQRVLSAKNIDHAQRGAIFAGFLKLLPVFILIVPGIIAKALYPDITGDEAYPALVSRLLPAGLRGIVVASLLAALMSSLASCFNSASTLFTMDVYKKLRPNASEKKLVTIGQLSTVVLVILGILWVPFIKHLSSQLYIYLQSVQAYISPPIAAVFVFGVFWTGSNSKGAISSLLTGLGLGSLRLILELVNKSEPLVNPVLAGYATMNFLHFAVLLFAICSFVLVAVSMMTGRPEQHKLDGLTFAYADQGSGSELGPQQWRKSNAIASLILLATVFALWTIFF